MKLDIFEDSKYKVIKNYFKTDINWDRALELLYKHGDNSQSGFNVLWFKIKNRKIFNEMPELKIFCDNINKDFDSYFDENCKFNDNWLNGRCTCGGLWHMDGPVISLAHQTMSAHKDLTDTCYLQVLGKSFWKLNGQETVILGPGDILFVSKEITHEVWGEGPRLGILMVSKWAK
jgi:hypothetical protein